MTLVGTPVKSSLRTLLVDDSTLFREGLAGLLEAAGLEVVDQLAGDSALEAATRYHRPDVVVIDVCLPPTYTDEGLAAALSIKERFPDIGVCLLSTYENGAWAERLLSAGNHGMGYLLKNRVGDVRDFVTSLRRVAAGGVAVDPSIVSLLVGASTRRSPLDSLSVREREVLALMAEGLTNMGIGQRLFLSSRTVETHIAAIFAKLPLDGDDNVYNRRVRSVLRYLQEESLGLTAVSC